MRSPSRLRSIGEWTDFVLIIDPPKIVQPSAGCVETRISSLFGGSSSPSWRRRRFEEICSGIPSLLRCSLINQFLGIEYVPLLMTIPIFSKKGGGKSQFK